MKIAVQLGNRSYPVYVDEKESFAQAYTAHFSRQRCAIVTNETIASLYAHRIASLMPNDDTIVIAIPDGERFKTIETWAFVLDKMLENRLDRKSVVIALGGGVVGDIAGFAAASFMRGIPCVQIPTTLLAMVDSSVGGKTAVDHPRGKNLIGAFHQPSFVWVDTTFLDTLPMREYFAGLAEVFKYAFIGGKDMFDFIACNFKAIASQESNLRFAAIEKSIAIKAQVVSEDEHEAGNRALLNFGHTFGHALEKVFGFNGLLHGEAIWWGMACAVDLARRTGSIPLSSEHAYTSLCSQFLMPQLPSIPDCDAVFAAMFSDKKAASGVLSFILPSQPGTSVIKKDIPHALVKETINAVIRRKKGLDR
jgi:3-dehydroquinate synthase